MMKSKLVTVMCDPLCGFMVRSHDKKEIIEMIKHHTKHVHKMNVANEDIEAMMNHS